MLEKFIETYGESLFERMMENVYGNVIDKDITVNVEHVDRLGLNKSGTIHIVNDEIDVIVEFSDGNWNGTQIFNYHNLFL